MMQNFWLNPNIDWKVLCYPEIRNSKKFKTLIELLKKDNLKGFFELFPEGKPIVKKIDKISNTWVLVYIDIDFTYDLETYYTLLGNCNDKYKFSLIPRNKENEWKNKTRFL